MEMIEENKYQQVLNEGLMLDHYYVLYNLRKGIKNINNKRINGFVNLLEKKGYIENGNITEAGEAVLNIHVKESVLGETVEKIKIPEWAETVHDKCVDLILKLTKGRQIRASIGGKSYAFLCNKVDMTKRLIKVATLYKVKELKLMEKCILTYIENSIKKKVYFPTVEYYIFKDNKSLLITDLQEIPSVEQEKSEFDIIDTNKLFSDGRK